MGEELYFKVASAQVDDRILMEHNAPSQIHIPAGTRLDIRFEYQLEETSKEEDLWTFRLEVHVDNKEISVAERKHVDRALFSDDTVCHVGIDIDFVVPGTYEMDYAVFADLSRRPWNQDAAWESVASDRYESKVTIHVDEPTDD